jgi:hypothetical protein
VHLEGGSPEVDVDEVLGLREFILNEVFVLERVPPLRRATEGEDP